jgi:hypothetical protein
MKIKKHLRRSYCAIAILFLVAWLVAPGIFTQAAPLTSARDYLSRVEDNLTSGVSHEIYINPATNVSGGSGVNKLILVFPDADDVSWCATAGTDLTVTASGLRESGPSGLPGSLTAKCTQGAGSSSYDTITIEGVNNLTAGTTYGVKVSDGTTGKLGTAANTTTGIVTVKTNNGSTDVDTKDIAFDILDTDQISFTATVNPTLSFSISDTSLGFGTMDMANVRYATSDEVGSLSEPGANSPANLLVSTNAASGVVISVRSANAGLHTNAGSGHTIAAAASTSISAGTEGVGVYGKSASLLTIDERFDNDSSSDGAITSSDLTFATAAGTVDGGDVDLSAKAAVSGATLGGDYTDTVTTTATGRF